MAIIYDILYYYLKIGVIIMRFIMSFLFLICMVGALIMALFYHSFNTGLEALWVVGMILTGIHLAWFAITADVKRK